MSEKEIVRTERAPAPFQGAPYNQAVKAAGFVFVAGQLGMRPGVGDGRRHDRRADRAGDAEPGRDPRGGGQRARPAREDDRLPPASRRLRRDERGLRATSATVRRPARRSRWRSSPSGALVEIEPSPWQASGPRRMAPCGTRSPTTCTRSGSTPTSSAARSATSCSGSLVRELDFVVPGVDHAGAAGALEPHGKVEDLIVADQRVG